MIQEPDQVWSLRRYGHNRSNVWDYPGANGFNETRNQDLAVHPTVKPAALVSDALLDASNRGDIILDPFSGSGTTILAAEQTQRKAAAIEIEPAYVDAAIKRYQEATGEPARLAVSNRPFDEVVDERSRWHVSESEAG